MNNKEKIAFQKTLKLGHQLIVSDLPRQNEVTLCNSEGTKLFSIIISENGTTLSLEATNINLEAKNNLKISAQDIEVESRADTKIVSQGDFKNYIKGDTMLLTQGEKLDIAKTQIIKSDLGNVDIVANDDVTLKGERIKLN